jgi:hypothetical protein
LCRAVRIRVENPPEQIPRLFEIGVAHQIRAHLLHLWTKGKVVAEDLDRFNDLGNLARDHPPQRLEGHGTIRIPFGEVEEAFAEDIMGPKADLPFFNGLRFPRLGRIVEFGLE